MYDEYEIEKGKEAETLAEIDKVLDEISVKYNLLEEKKPTDTRLVDEYKEIMKITDDVLRVKQLSKINKTIFDELKFSRHFE